MNDNEGQSFVWREMALRTRQRGSQAIGGRDWPGKVLLPSDVIERLIEERRIKIPRRWGAMSLTDLARFIGLLYAWQNDRLIFEFSGMATEVVVNSQVGAAMSAGAFGMMPAHAIYVDFESIDFRDRHLPGGFFAGINCNANSALELVLAVDKFNAVQMYVFPLTGRSADEVMQELLQAARAQGESRIEEQEAFAFIDRHLHAILSAILMIVATGVQSYQHVEDGVSKADGHSLWTRWGIKETFTESFNHAYSQALKDPSGKAPVVVAEWIQPSGRDTVKLRCSIGTVNAPGLEY